MAIASKFPTIRPSLDLNFASGNFDPRIDFTRNSSATYFGSDGLLKTASANEPRIDYDPVTGECKGFLVEEARTNLLTYSEQFDNATWGKPFNTVTLTNEILSPTGAANAYKIVRTSTSGALTLRMSGLSLPAGTTYSASIYIYVPEQSDVTSWSMINDFADIENESTPIYTVFNKWVRISTTSTLGGERDFFDFNVRVNGTQMPSVGFVCYAWGAQLEAGAFPTSYIKTEATAATRAADSAVMTGANFSSWYRQDEGVFAARFSYSAFGAFTRIFQVDDGTMNNAYAILNAAAGNRRIYVVSRTENVVQLDTSAAPINATQSVPASAAYAYKQNDFAFQYQSLPIVQELSGSVPVVNTLRLGANINVNHLNGHISRVAYYPKRLPNANLQALTA